MNSEDESAVSKARKSNLLVIDDEQPILTSLKRLFRGNEFQVFTAVSGSDGIEIIKKHDIDVVISDLNMPEIDGIKLLSAIAIKRPSIKRIILTGNADLKSAIKAINSAQIYSLQLKPWDNDQLKQTVRRSLQAKRLEDEKAILFEATARDNKKHNALLGMLEEKASQLALDLEQADASLDKANDELNNSYSAAVAIFSDLVDHCEGRTPGYSRVIAEQAEKIAKEMGLSDEEIKNIYYAGMLLNIGHIDLPEAIRNKSFALLGTDEKEMLTRHPIAAESALMSLSKLKKTAKIIRQHCEFFDGSGYPDHLSHDGILITAQILGAVVMYHKLVEGRVIDRNFTHQEAIDYLLQEKGSKYDTQVVDCAYQYLSHDEEALQEPDHEYINASCLIPGMKLIKPVTTHCGSTILTQGNTLTEALIDRMRKYEREHKLKLTFCVLRQEQEEVADSSDSDDVTDGDEAANSN